MDCCGWLCVCFYTILASFTLIIKQNRSIKPHLYVSKLNQLPYTRFSRINAFPLHLIPFFQNIFANARVVNWEKFSNCSKYRLRMKADRSKSWQLAWFFSFIQYSNKIIQNWKLRMFHILTECFWFKSDVNNIPLFFLHLLSWFFNNFFLYEFQCLLHLNPHKIQRNSSPTSPYSISH